MSPQKAAGIRIDPPASEPIVANENLALMAAALPLEEPPVILRSSSGFLHRPNHALTPVPPAANGHFLKGQPALPPLKPRLISLPRRMAES